MKKLSVSCLLLVLISASINAETDTIPADKAILSFRFKNINFLRDNEYANPITEGYTLLGYFIQPTFVYSPLKRLEITLGVQILNYAGTDKIRTPMLIFSTKYKIAKNTSLIFGALDGCDKHRMDDPNYYAEKLYTNYTENGIRIVTEKEKLFNDIWVNWENFIFKGDTTREIFQVGESFNYISPRFLGRFDLEIPVQVIFRHLGGQISDYPEHVETFCNGSAGLRINYSLGDGKYGRVAIEYQQFRFQYVSAHGNIGIKYGDAHWLRLHYNFRSFYFGSYYWKGHNFYAPEGNPIYSSISERTPDAIIPDRSILTNSVYYTIHPAKFFEIFAGVDSYYDLLTRHMDGAITLHLRFDQMFTIFRSK